MAKEVKSVYNTGASDGLVMGLYLSAIFLVQAYGFRHGWLMILGDIMMLGVPVVAYKILRRGHTDSMGVYTFSAVWMHGIVTFLCGSLIMALVMYGYMRFVQPGFVAMIINNLSDAYRQLGTPEAIQMADTLQRIISKHLLPSPIEMAFTSIWLVSFSGAMLSMLLAAIIKYTGKRKKIVKKEHL